MTPNTNNLHELNHLRILAIPVNGLVNIFEHNNLNEVVDLINNFPDLPIDSMKNLFIASASKPQFQTLFDASLKSLNQSPLFYSALNGAMTSLGLFERDDVPAFQSAMSYCDWNMKRLIEHIVDKNAYRILQFLLDDSIFTLQTKVMLENIGLSPKMLGIMAKSRECSIILFAVTSTNLASVLRNMNVKLAFAAKVTSITLLRKYAVITTNQKIKALYYQTYMEREDKTPLDLIADNYYTNDNEFLLTLLA